MKVICLCGLTSLLISPGVVHAAVSETWVQRYNGPANTDDRASALAVDGSGNVIVAGHSYNNGGNADGYTAKYAATNGTLLWERRYAFVAGGDDSALAVAVDDNGNVFVTGNSWNGSSADFYTAKYAAGSGALLWERRYNAPANGDDRAVALAVDGSGHVVVTGTSQNTNGFTDCYTAKYSGVNGTVFWERRYSGAAGGDHSATALALDNGGNALVTGTSWNGNNTDYYTAKYAAANGALLWERHFNGPANGDELARAVAVDGGGNAVVTGLSHNGTNYDSLTIKYAAADGSLLWEQRYNGPANRSDEGRAVAVDSSGHAIITGYSDNPTNTDYYTAKYAAADGTLLWEQRYNGAANGDDEAVAVTVDSSGTVYVTGSSENTNYVSGYATVAYDSNGTEIWVALYDGSGPGNMDSTAGAMALDSARHVYVTGSSGNDYATVRYDQTVVAGPPIITAQPAARTVRPGTNVSFSVGVFGTAPYTYQWQRDGTNLADGGRISGAAGPVLTIANVFEGDSGIYSVIVTNDFGTAPSSNATLIVSALDHFTWSVAPSPQFVNLPFAVTIEARDASNRVATNYTGPAALTASAPGGGTSDTMLGAINHSGASSAEYTLGYSFTPSRNITITAVRHYFGTKVSLWTDEGALVFEQLVTSVPGTWVETPLPTPVLLSAGTRYRLTSYTGGGIYYWRNDAAPMFVNGSIDESFSVFGNGFPTNTDLVRWWMVDLRHTASIPVASFPTNSGSFTNGIWSGLIAVHSAATNLSLRAEDITGRAGLSQPIQVVSTAQPPVILTQPMSQGTVTGATVHLSASVYATPPLAWQWRFNGGTIAGATNAILTLENVSAGQSGEYSVTVTNPFGSVTSSNALLTVFAVPPFFDDFEPGIDPLQWTTFSPTVAAANYGSGSISGVNALWFGGTGSRFAQTRPINTQAGGVVDFYLVLSDGEMSFWEVPDLPHEGIVLEYSITGGASWVEFGRYDTSFYYDWRHVVATIPTEARTASTQFRWRQLSNNGIYSDHWALDDVSVLTGPQTVPAIRFTWSNIPSPQVTNLPFFVSIQMRNPADEIITNFAGTVSLSGVAGGTVPVTPAVSGDFTNGVWSGFITVSNPATNLVLRADDGAGNSGYSTPFSVIRSNQAPIIVTHPSAQTVGITTFVVMSVGAVGNLPMGYQWRRNGTNISNGGRISGATSSTLIISNALETDSGLYSVLVLNSFGNATSSNALLSVTRLHHFTWGFISSPVSTLQPFTVTIRARDYTNGNVTNFTGTVAFSASVIGSGAPVPVTPTVSSAFVNGVWRGSLSISQIATNVVLRAEEISGAFGVSAPVNTAPVAYFTLQPTNQYVLPGTNVTLAALAVGTGPLRYQWRFEGTNIPGATNSTYSFVNASVTNGHGRFDVVATDNVSVVASSNALVFIRIRPAIVLQPLAQQVVQGGNALFICQATGAPPLFYRWLTNGVSMTTNTSGVFVYPNAQKNLTVRANVYNAVGNANSFSVALTVLGDSDHDGMADLWEVQYGFNTNNAADALLDFDGDGMSNHDEFVAGTNPTNQLSFLKIDSVVTWGSGLNSLLIGFSAISNKTYTLQYREATETAGWSNLLNSVPAPTNRSVSFTNAPPAATSTRFYRLVTPRQDGQ